MKTITVQCPDSLLAQLDAFVREGWVNSQNEAILDALRRFLASHKPQLIRAQIQRDVEWGLRGDE